MKLGVAFLMAISGIVVQAQWADFCPGALSFYNSSDIDRALEEYRDCREEYWQARDYSRFFESYWMVLDCISKRQETRTLLEELRHLQTLEQYVPDTLKAANAHVLKQFKFLLYRLTGDLGAAADIQHALLDSLAGLRGPPDRERLGRIFKSLMYLSEVYLDQGSYRQALYHASMAIDTGMAIYDYVSADGFILTPHYVMVRAYMLTGDYPGAASELNRILSIIPQVKERQSERWIKAYIDIARLYEQQGITDSVKHYVRLLKQEPAAFQFNTPIRRLQAEYLVSEGFYGEAIRVYTSLIDSLDGNGGYDADVLGDIHVDLADVYLYHLEAPQPALENYHKAIYTFSSEDTAEDVRDNPQLKSLYGQVSLIAALKGKSAALGLLASQSAGKIRLNFRELAWQAIRLGLDFVESARAGYQTAEERAKLIEESYLLYHTALEHCLAMSAAFGEGAWTDTAFALMQGSKALNLLDDLTHKQARELAGIPDSLVGLELATIADINQLKSVERELRRDPVVNRDAIRRTLAALKVAESALDSLIGQFEKAYPEYTHAVDNGRVITLSKARSTLDRDVSVLEYFSASENLETFLLHYDRKRASLSKCTAPDSAIAAIRLLNQSFDETLEDTDHTIDNTALLHALHDLYRWFVAPAGPLNPRITVVPDGVLHGLPFTALLTRPPEQIHDLREQPYLILGRSVSYSYSSALKYQMNKSAAYRARGSYAFSPLIDSATGFAPLAYGAVEAQKVGESLGAHVVDGRNCAASVVRAILQDDRKFKVMHFATHGVADLDHGADSYLQFSGTTDSSRIYAYDLYGLDLDAVLVYLSACQTASGSRQTGEGVVSLARGFFRSGVRNLVTTLRKVGDRQAEQVTEVFYEQLLMGQRVDVALAEAQRSYLASLDTEERYLAHPAYWSGFVAYGDSRAVFSRYGRWWLWSGIALTVCTILLLIFRKRHLNR